MNKCDRCGKGVQVGMNVSHSHIRTKKRSRPNVHPFRVKEGNVTKRLRLCTKCLRLAKKGLRSKENENMEAVKEVTSLPA
jgi:large subunit ribosomal protein L28